MDRARLVTVLTVLVLLGSGLSLTLALTRPDPEPAVVPPGAVPYEPADLAGPSGAAVATAVAALPLALSYDFRDLRGGLAAATAGMTQQFARDFTRTSWRRAAPIAREREEVSEAVVRGAGVVRTRGEDAATVLVFVDRRQLQGEGMDSGDAPRLLSSSRVLVDLVRRAGSWRISDIRSI